MEYVGGRKKRGRKRKVRFDEPYDEKRFINKEAEDIYELHRTKALIKERGLDVSMEEVPRVRKIMEAYGWVQGDGKRAFADHPNPVAVNLVHEFYANLKASTTPNTRIVSVRKKNVDFGLTRITEFYNLVEQEDCWFKGESRSNIDWEAFLGQLAKPGAKWVYAKNGKPKEFMREMLSKDLRFLVLFLNAKVFPTTHNSSLTRDRALLLFGLTWHKPIDLSTLISDSIMEAALGAGNRGYVMPSLITALCLDSGVSYGDDEPWEEPNEMLDGKFYMTMKKDADEGWTGGPEKKAPTTIVEYF